MRVLFFLRSLAVMIYTYASLYSEQKIGIWKMDFGDCLEGYIFLKCFYLEPGRKSVVLKSTSWSWESFSPVYCVHTDNA